jgi:general secretion pathway protein D
VKTILSTLLLTSLCAWAQTTNTPGPPGFPNADEVTSFREQAVRRAMEARSNALAASAATNAGIVAGATSGIPVVPPRSFPRPIPSLRSNVTGTASAPAAPGTGIAPAVVAPGTNTLGGELAAIPPPPGTTNGSLDALVEQGLIDFRGVDLPQVFGIYAELVNRTILRPTSLPAQNIWLTAATPLTRREAIQALDAVLGLNGITMINIGDKFVKAVAQGEAGGAGAVINKGDSSLIPDLGPFTTHVVQLKYTKPTEIATTLQPFAKIPNAILPFDSSQMLVLRDYAENVKRMLELIKQIDVSIPSEYISEVIPIKYAIASDIANALNSLGAGGGATVGSGGAGGSTLGGSRGGSTMGRGSMGRSGFGRSGSGGYGGYGSGGYSGGYGGYGGGYGGYGGVTPYATVQPGVTQPGAAPGTSFTDRLRSIINKSNPQEDIQVIGKTKLIADERTNSLLIFATREDMKTIKDIVNKLDVVLAQVLIECVIVEISLNNNLDLGISYLQHPQSAGGFTGVGAVNNTTFLNQQSFSGLTNAAGGLAGGFNYLATLGGELDVTLKAVAGDSRARILQRPRIQTSHAIAAHLFVGESRPYPTGSYYGGGAYGGYSAIQQMQIGVGLDVTPLINPDGLVVMDIQQSVESVSGTVNIANVGDVPITSSKQAGAQVAVRDKDTIMLGGLIQSTKNKSKSGVPYLKDIPLLGFLFRSSTEQETRGELIVLIRPTVLPTPEIAALNAKAEKERMPAVRLAEQEMRADDAVRLKKAEAEEKEMQKAADKQKSKASE